MNKILVFFFILLLLLASQVHAYSQNFWEAGKFRTSFDVDIQSISLKDPSDSIYIGTVGGTGWGFGGNAAMLYPLNDSMRIGPNFNFSYGKINTSWYEILLF